jgi:hypothetical protein
VILPFIIIGVFSYLGRIRWREIAMVILPVFLISGVWHTHLWITHQQILWSNHGGFNLALAWPQVDTSQTVLVPELNNEPVAVGRWPNINTEEHALNSQLLSAEVFRYIRDNPIDSFRYLGLRYLDFFVEAGPMHKSTRPVMIVFNGYIHFGLAYISVNLTTLILYLISSKMRLIKLLGNIDNMIIFIASSTLFITAIGSAVEESRLVLSAIPLITALPYAKLINMRNLLFSTRLIAIITVSIGVLTIIFGIAGEHVSGFSYGEHLSRFERNILYFLGSFYIVFGPMLYKFPRQELTENRLLSQNIP